MRFGLLIAGSAATLLTACSSDAPRAPIGLDRRPANSPATMLSLRSSGSDTGKPPLVVGERFSTSGAEPKVLPDRAPANTVPAIPASLTVVIVSDASAPLGLASLSQAERTQLVASAKAARQIVLLCRGDRLRPSPASWTAALRRGVRVKLFLVGEGVDPKRISLLVRSAGAFVANNRTPSGRATNRRVEIHFA